jgi:hypothetical protein
VCVSKIIYCLDENQNAVLSFYVVFYACLKYGLVQ